MKKILLTISALFVAIMILAHGSYGPAGYCNDPAHGRVTCVTTNCHATKVTQPWSSITSNVPGSGYIPGNTYTITATVTRSNHSEFGFQVSDQQLNGVTGGQLTSINTAVQIRDSLSNHYATHTGTGTTGTNGFHTWQFNWVAPASGTGLVRFFGAFNITNNNNSRLGDTIVLDSMTVLESVMGISSEMESLPRLKIFPNPVSDYLTAEYYVEQPSRMEIMLVDSRGANASLLFSDENFAGDFQKVFELKGKYSAGVYFLKTVVGEKASVQRLVIL
jgi:hypothetical protein